MNHTIIGIPVGGSVPVYVSCFNYPARVFATTSPNVNISPDNVVIAANTRQEFIVTALTAGPVSILISWITMEAAGNLPVFGTVDDQQSQGGTRGNFESSNTSGDPINTFTGELFNHFAPDINRGGPMPLIFSRYYASGLKAANITGALGDNWRHNFEWTMTSTAATAVITSNFGRTITFAKTGVLWGLTGKTDIAFQLAESAGVFTLLDPRTKRMYVFNSGGQLTSIQDGKGNAHALNYNGSGQLTQVSDGLGRILTFTYNASGQLASVAGDGGQTISFSYLGGNLASFTNALNQITTYAYAAGGLMTSSILPAGNTPFTQTYNAAGKVASQTDANGNTTTLVYAGANTTITGPLGNNRVHTHTATGELANSTDQTGKSAIIGSDATGRRNAITDRLGDTTSMTYHAPSGKLAGVTHADGTMESFAYTPRNVSGNTVFDLSGATNADGTTIGLIHDAFGNLISRTDQRGNTSTATYNGLGQVLTATNKLLGVTTNSYNADATLASTMDPATNTTLFGYDLLKRLNLITNADSSTRSITYDPANHPLTTTNENGNTTTLTWDANGNLATVQDPLGQTTTLAYDGNERLISATDPLGGVSSMSYHPLGGIGTVTDANGNVTTFGYNTLGRLTSITDALFNVRSRTYDAEKIIASTTDPLLNTTTFASDKLGRITQATSPLGNINKVSYDPVGRIATMTDGLNQVTTLNRDARGRITGITLPGGTISSTITRNALGEPTAITDPNGNGWQRGYDTSGRLTSDTDPLAQTTTTTYDNRNRPQVITFPGALGTRTLAYDGVSNLTGSSYTDGTVFGFIYDANNRLTASNNGGVTPNNMTRAYDAAGRISNSNGIAITRDAGGRILTMTLATGKTVTYAYDANNHVTSVTDWAGGVTTFSYDNAGRLTNITRPNGVNTTNTWDNDSRLIGISEGAVSSINLTRDAKGQITAATRTVPTVATASGVANSANTFDAASQVAGNTYDARGRQTAAGADTFTWDGASRLTGYTVGGVTASNTYDALGYRTRRTVGAASSDFVWNGALGLASISIERRAGADFRYFIHTPGGALLYSMDATTNARSFYHFDEMGNTIFVTNDAGATIGSYAYTPFGELIAATGGLDNPFTWQGQNGVMDEGSGLYYVRARFYDAKSGRFISRDIKKFITPRQVNQYQYALNNPLHFVDINGRGPFKVDSGLGFVTGRLGFATTDGGVPNEFSLGEIAPMSAPIYVDLADDSSANEQRQSVKKRATTTDMRLGENVKFIKGGFSLPVIDTSRIVLRNCAEDSDSSRRLTLEKALSDARQAVADAKAKLADKEANNNATGMDAFRALPGINSARSDLEEAEAILRHTKEKLESLRLGLRSVVPDIQGVLCLS